MAKVHEFIDGRNRKAGFTLIELLVVVAIIAILAAIAVPNFLEAQVRAKVARAKSDCRAAGIGIEAYAVDNNRYPYLNKMYHTYLTEIPVLTTPINYLASVPQDVFPLGQAESGHEISYRYYSVAFWSTIFKNLSRRNWKWAVMSNGPDREISLHAANVQDAIDGNFWMIYDPTNGTLSSGDIWSSNVSGLGGSN